MKAVDRYYYCPTDPYDDRPQSIGYNATISAPHMHAYALELLRDHLKFAKRSLDVGSGTGYLTVCFKKMMRTEGSISYGIEHIPQLAKSQSDNIKASPDKSLLDSGDVVIYEGDGRKGLEKYAPFDAIHVGAAAPEVPKDLLAQLAKGGRMLIPVGPSGNQDFLIIDKDQNGKITQKKALGVMYVPLTDAKKQWPGY
eukprot:CAMPEP_0114576632 /NCGR_PEP_ID=MMETSP0125-20121206/1366_1 /TAXON_ID=485358 ORGANISM="Aristerostoma sp., Strain ATCC 50986" /NCGR_SAMPLE_ID=MMETSP0125 /ASSEMBLY_ACC=CAM_ASM_000245 /LENGTH=196 /DNA_ID=CAMNT_0001765285 /DNA_START=39 /DNA_END=629 /DNA_ORIENTATION=+